MQKQIILSLLGGPFCFSCCYLLSVGKGLDLSLDNLRTRDGLSEADVLELTRVKLHLQQSDTRGRQSRV